MTIYDMIKNASDIKDLNAVTYLKDILKFSENNHITINQTIAYLNSLNPRPYHKNILNTIARYYPFDTENAVSNFSNSSINISKMNEHPRQKIRMFIRRN